MYFRSVNLCFLLFYNRGEFSQWSADNVDHNVRTIDGHRTFHGMGIICSTTGEIQQSEINNQQIIRQQQKPVNEIIKNKGIPIVPYHSDINGLQNIKLKQLHQLDWPRRYQLGFFLALLLPC